MPHHPNIKEFKLNGYEDSWVKKFKSHPEFEHIKLKALEPCIGGFPPISLRAGMYDVVDIEEYCAIEAHRIPLFVGCQFGVYPKVKKLPEFFNGEKLIAILGKSVTSGHVSGLKIFKIPGRHDLWDECRLSKYEIYSF